MVAEGYETLSDKLDAFREEKRREHEQLDRRLMRVETVLKTDGRPPGVFPGSRDAHGEARGSTRTCAELARMISPQSGAS